MDQLLKRLTAINEDEFLLGVRDLPTVGGVSADRILEVITALAQEWSQASLLPVRIQADRFRAILARVGLTPELTLGLIQIGPDLPPHLKNALAELLPPAARGELVSGTRRRQTPEAPVAPEVIAVAIQSQHELHAGVGGEEPRSESGSTADVSTTPSSGRPNSTVLLLSRVEHQDANKSLLSGAEYGTLVWESVERATDDMRRNTDICGFVIDQSILRELDVKAQEELFSNLASYSTFAHIRVDSRALALSVDQIRTLIKQARCLAGEVPHHTLSIQPDGTLREAELPEFRRATDALNRYVNTRYTPGELSLNELNLLIAAAASHLSAREVGDAVQIQSIETRFLHGGFSTARIAMVRADGVGRPIVAKIAEKAHVLDEIRRFQRYIQPLDDQLHPEVHFHSDAALILFALVRSAEEDLQPAETVQAALTRVWNDQLLNGRDDTTTFEHLAMRRALQRVSDRLFQLSQRAPDPALPGLSSPTFAHAESLEARGFGWGLAEDTIRARRIALDRFDALNNRATVHGDLHLGNVLLRGDSSAHLIDYASAGPGHPALDLVRYELALYLQMVRQLESEADSLIFQRRLTLEEAPLDALAADFPGFSKCLVNDVCLHGIVSARDQALRAVQVHRGVPYDYWCTKYVVAWQNLGMPDRHTGLARATISALTDAILKGPP